MNSHFRKKNISFVFIYLSVSFLSSFLDLSVDELIQTHGVLSGLKFQSLILISGKENINFVYFFWWPSPGDESTRTRHWPRQPAVYHSSSVCLVIGYVCKKYHPIINQYLSSVFFCCQRFQNFLLGNLFRQMVSYRDWKYDSWILISGKIYISFVFIFSCEISIINSYFRKRKY